MDVIKFRTPYRCQNGHARFGFTTIREDGYAKLEWGTANCSCPTADIGQGFRVVGEHELFTGVKDSKGVEIYENDIVLGFGIVEWYCDRDEGYNGWTFLDLEKGYRHDFWYLTFDLQVVDYAPQSEFLSEGERSKL